MLSRIKVLYALLLMAFGTIFLPGRRQHRVALNLLDRFFCAWRDGQVSKLWDVLCALRGPDEEDLALKHRTTSVIRALAFPRAHKSCDGTRAMGGYVSLDPPSDWRTIRQSLRDFTSGHFASHVGRALDVLVRE